MAKTKSGFEFEFSEGITDDFELLELSRKLIDNPLMIIDVAKKLIGEDGYEALKKHCTIDGRISAKMMDEEITEIYLSDKNAKK